jgi:hypothetical protein
MTVPMPKPRLRRNRAPGEPPCAHPDNLTIIDVGGGSPELLSFRLGVSETGPHPLLDECWVVSQFENLQLAIS